MYSFTSHLFFFFCLLLLFQSLTNCMVSFGWGPYLGSWWLEPWASDDLLRNIYPQWLHIISLIHILSYGAELQYCRKNVPPMVLVAVTVTQFYDMSQWQGSSVHLRGPLLKGMQQFSIHLRFFCSKNVFMGILSEKLSTYKGVEKRANLIISEKTQEMMDKVNLSLNSTVCKDM